jgi:dipeptidyl aminopeptidase/acylaminoacyl peptidase
LDARIGTTSWSPDGRWIAFSGGGRGNYDIWKVSVPDGRVVRLTADERYEVAPTWTPDSRGIVYVLVDDRWVDHEVRLMDADGGGDRLVVADLDFFDYRTSSGRPNFPPPQVSPDGNRVLFSSWRSGWINYYTVPIGGGEPEPIAPERWDQTGARWSPDGARIAFISNHNGTHDLRVVSSTGGTPEVVVDPEMGVVADPEWSPGGDGISYSMGSPTSARDLYVVSLASGESRRLTHSTPGGGVEERLVVPEKVTYPSDTLPINAYLFRPRDIRAGDRFPGIVFAHGGPTGQYVDTYQMQMQFFASQGYVVLAPNFKGGSGYGRAFADLNDGCWAHCDLDDLVAGAEYLRTLPFVDPANIGITGTSHGGLLSMAAATFAPGIFQASIPHGGTADRIHYYHTQELRHIKQAEDEFGPLDGNEETYRYVSPFYSAAQVNTPMFVIWGEGKWPASDNSARYVAELDRLYKPHRAKVYFGENYYVSSRANVRQMLLDMLEFFDDHLRPGS